MRRKYKQYTVSDKLEAIQSRQNGLTEREIHKLFGVSTTSLHIWEKAYREKGLAGLENVYAQRREGASQSPKVEAAGQVLSTELKAPEAAPGLQEGLGVGKAQGILHRHGFLDVAKETVRKLLRGQGVGPILRTRRRHRQPVVRSFERAKPNELWQTDIMTFMLRGQYRLYLIGFMDDNSRFLVGWGLYRFQTSANVLEVFRAAIEKHGMPQEVLSDNGRQYYTWRGRSKFTKFLTKMGIRHIRSRPYHPQTCGKIESFWRNLLQECLYHTPLSSFEEAKEKIGEYIEYYNFKRPHQGIGNLMPSDRFFQVDGPVKRIIAENTKKLEEQTKPVADYKAPTYLVGNIGGRELRVIAKDAQVSLSEKTEEPDGKFQGETALSPREAGLDSAGPVGPTTHQETLRPSGSLQDHILPVDEAGQRSLASSLGNPDARPQEAQGPQEITGEGGETRKEGPQAIQEAQTHQA
jgi:transposase InsO family protein